MDALRVLDCALGGGRRSKALIWAGVVAGVTFETKYGIAIWLIGLAVGVIATQARKVLSWPQLWYGIAAFALIGAPSLIWQQTHGWPFLATINYAREHRNLTGTPVRFEIQQILAMNFMMAPLWITGIIAPFTVERLRPARFLSIAFVVTTVLIIYTRGKDYYLAPAYPSMFAVGAVACRFMRPWLKVAWFAAATALTLPILPVVLPILNPPALAAYLDNTHLRPRPTERESIGAPLTQVFSDELGWRSMEKQVAEIYRSLPSQDRSQAAIMTMDYREPLHSTLRTSRRASSHFATASILFQGHSWLRWQRHAHREWRYGEVGPDLQRDQGGRFFRSTSGDAVRKRGGDSMQVTSNHFPRCGIVSSDFIRFSLQTVAA